MPCRTASPRERDFPSVPNLLPVGAGHQAVCDRTALSVINVHEDDHRVHAGQPSLGDALDEVFHALLIQEQRVLAVVLADRAYHRDSVGVVQHELAVDFAHSSSWFLVVGHGRSHTLKREVPSTGQPSPFEREAIPIDRIRRICGATGPFPLMSDELGNQPGATVALESVCELGAQTARARGGVEGHFYVTPKSSAAFMVPRPVGGTIMGSPTLCSATLTTLHTHSTSDSNDRTRQ